MDKPNRVIMLGVPNSQEDPRVLADAALDKLLQEVARTVRTAYCTCKRQLSNQADYGEEPLVRWDGGVDQFGKTHKPVWPKIAAEIIKLGADPLQYVRAHFLMSSRNQAPYPNQLYGEKAIRIWEQFQETQKELVRNQVESDENQLRVAVLPFTVTLHWELKRALRYVLCDHTKNITPLTRYCTAVRESLPDVADRYFENALIQYMFQMSEYDAVMVVPAEFKAAAVRLRTRMTG